MKHTNKNDGKSFGKRRIYLRLLISFPFSTLLLNLSSVWKKLPNLCSWWEFLVLCHRAASEIEALRGVREWWSFELSWCRVPRPPKKCRLRRQKTIETPLQCMLLLISSFYLVYIIDKTRWQDKIDSFSSARFYKICRLGLHTCSN